MSREKDKKPQTPANQNDKPKEDEQEEEEELDEALEESFPASDPISPTRPDKN